MNLQTELSKSEWIHEAPAISWSTLDPNAFTFSLHNKTKKMSFFNKKVTTSGLKISQQNIRSLCATNQKLAIKKMISILNQKADIYNQVSVRTNETDFSKLINHETIKYKMSYYTYRGSFCKNCGVVLLYRKGATEIKNF